MVAFSASADSKCQVGVKYNRRYKTTDIPPKSYVIAYEAATRPIYYHPSEIEYGKTEQLRDDNNYEFDGGCEFHGSLCV